jgi:hypothetical protein
VDRTGDAQHETHSGRDVEPTARDVTVIDRSVAGAGGSKASEPRRAAAADQVVVGDIPRESPGFQPRAGLLAQLDRAGAGVSVIRSAARMPGVGTTELAAAFARAKVAAGWRLVAWVSAEDTDSLLAGLATVAGATGPSDGESESEQGDAARVVRHRLEADGERCLLVFDDATDPDVLRPFVPVSGAARVLITSTQPSAADLGTAVPVDVFTADEAQAFLAGRTGRVEAEGAAALAVELGYLPLALAQAAAVIAGQHLGYGAYVDQLRAVPVRESLIQGDGQRELDGVARAVLLSLKATHAADQTGLCIRVMEVLAVMPAAGVRRELLHTAGYAGALTAGDHRVTTALVDQALEQLAEQSLLTVSLDGQTVIAHRLVTLAVRDEMARRRRLTVVCRAVASVLEARARALEASRDRRAVRDLPGQVTALLAGAGLMAEVDEELTNVLLDLRCLVLDHLIELGDSATQAIAVGEPLAADLERLLGPDHPRTLNTRNRLAVAYQNAGRATEAILLFELILATPAARVFEPTPPVEQAPPTQPAPQPADPAVRVLPLGFLWPPADSAGQLLPDTIARASATLTDDEAPTIVTDPVPVDVEPPRRDPDQGARSDPAQEPPAVADQEPAAERKPEPEPSRLERTPIFGWRSRGRRIGLRRRAAGVTDDVAASEVIDPVPVDAEPPPRDPDQSARPDTTEKLPPPAALSQAPDHDAPAEPAVDHAPATEQEPVADREPVAEPEAEADQEPVADQEPEVDQQPVADGEPVAEHEPAVDQEPVADREPVAEPEPQAEHEPVAEQEPVAEPEAEADQESEAEQQPVADGEPVAEHEPAADQEPVADREPAADREPVAEQELVADPEAEADQEPEADQQPAADHEPVAEPEPEVEHEPEPERSGLERPGIAAQHPRDRHTRRTRVVGLVAAFLILMVAGGVTFALAQPHANPRPSGHAPPAAAGPVQMAAEWISQQVSRSAIVACDPAMCSALEDEGVPAANLLILRTTTASPLHAQLVVATPMVRSQFGNRLDSVYAPTVIAGFGSGSGRVNVQVVAPAGAAAYLTALRQDVAARQVAGAQLLANKHIMVTAQARMQLTAGEVDSRLLIMLPALAAVHPIQVLAFGDPGPGATPGVPLCSADLSGSGQAAGMTDASYLSWLTSFVRAQLLPFDGSVATVRQGDQLVVHVEFSRPSPLGLLGHG